MAIYMVQHSFARPDWEDEWNAWYVGNLRVLMSVPGFRTGQRFKASEGQPPRYMAMYTVDAGVFETQTYIDAGGNGVNSQRFRPAYEVWIRNLFQDAPPAPAVGSDECLVCMDTPTSPASLPGITLSTMAATGFHKTTPYRALGVIKQAQMAAVPKSDNIILYLPFSEPLGPLY